MKNLFKKLGLLTAMTFFAVGCSSNSTDQNKLTLEEITSSKWHLVDMKGFDSQKEIYQKFYVSFSEDRFGGKAFNSFNTHGTINADGTIDLSPQAVTTRMALRSKEYAMLENTFIKRATEAKVWSTKDHMFILGAGEDQLTFKQATK